MKALLLPFSDKMKATLTHNSNAGRGGFALAIARCVALVSSRAGATFVAAGLLTVLIGGLL